MTYHKKRYFILPPRNFLYYLFLIVTLGISTTSIEIHTFKISASLEPESVLVDGLAAEQHGQELVVLGRGPASPLVHPPPHNSIKWVSLESLGCLVYDIEW